MSLAPSTNCGPIALVGGGEWREGATLDAELLAHSDGEVLVLPTAAAYEHPERSVSLAQEWFAALGGSARPLMVLRRGDAENEEFADTVHAARFVYLCGGSPLHLRSVLKDSLVLHAIVHAWKSGAVVAGSDAGAMVLTDPMVDPRGGAFTVGFGLVRNVAIVPRFTGELTPQLRRTLALAPSSYAVVSLAERCALIRETDGTWRDAGPHKAVVHVDGAEAGLEALAGKPLI